MKAVQPDRTPPADPWKAPEVAEVARELQRRGYELRECCGRFSAWRLGRIHFASDDPERLLLLTQITR